MLDTGAAVLLLTYVPGALLFRLPFGDRSSRAALPAEERLFWAIVLGVACSSIVGLGLAAGSWYRFDRLLWFNGLLSLVLLAALLPGGRFRFGETAPRHGWAAVVPLVLVLVAAWLSFRVPPAEYVIGGRDPGTYVNEGIQIAQRGSWLTTDGLVASVPERYRGGLFFSLYGDPTFYSNFMGFFLIDPDAGLVGGQFPHLYPLWIAIAYGLNGLSGARWVIGYFSLLGVLAVYFTGARLAGRAAGAAGALLLALHVLQIWYARFPNAETVMQPLLFAGVLATLRAQDGDRFFVPVAASLLTLALFAHLTAVVAVAAVGAAVLFGRLEGQPLRLGFLALLAVGGGLYAEYLMVVLPRYWQFPFGFFENLTPLQLSLLAALLAGGVTLLAIGSRMRFARVVRQGVPLALAGVLCAATVYGLWFRYAAGRLAAHDADALRHFTTYYLTPYGLLAALVGFVLLTWRGVRGRPGGPAADRGHGPWPFLFTLAAFSLVFFYKVRVVPEHFWAGRRFVAMILPGMLLVVGAAAFGPLPWPEGWGRRPWQRWGPALRYTVGTGLVTAMAWQFLTRDRPILDYVEYAGVIPQLEQLATQIGDDDLVLVESRGVSDLHVLALPLAYIYARNVLVIRPTTPDRILLEDFLGWARSRFARVLFLGGAGNDLLSPTLSAVALDDRRFRIPEYEAAWNAYPTHANLKAFDFGLFELRERPAARDGLDVDIGSSDHLFVRGFMLREENPDGISYRWSGPESSVSVPGLAAEDQQVTVWMNGGRPEGAGPADVDVFLDDRLLGSVTATNVFAPYRFEIPDDLARQVAASPEASELRLVSRTWSPGQVLDTADMRDLGVMVDRVTIDAGPGAAPTSEVTEAARP